MSAGALVLILSALPLPGLAAEKKPGSRINYCPVWPVTESMMPAGEQTDLADNVIYASAKSLELDLHKTIQMSGDVRFKQNANYGSSELLNYNFDSQVIVLSDQVELNIANFQLTGQRITLNHKTETVAVDNAHYLFRSDDDTFFRGNASHITYRDDVMVARNAQLTSCLPGDNTWSIYTRHLSIDKNKRWGTARHLIFRAGKIPLLYLPWISFPLGDGRKTGFLLPSVGLQDGKPDIALPYYLNLAPNYDATITPRLLTNRGLLMSGQFRLLTENTNHIWEASWIYRDRVFRDQQNRWRLSWQHQGQWGYYWDTLVDYAALSDDDYYKDFGTSVSNSLQADLRQIARLRYSRGGWVASLQARQFQTLDGDNDADQYNLVPQLNLSWHSSAQQQLQWSVQSSAARFVRNTNDLICKSTSCVTGSRLQLQPLLHYDLKPLHGNMGFKLSWRWNYYDLTNQKTGKKNKDDISSLQFSIDRELSFYQYGKAINQKYLHILKPRIQYLYSYANEEQSEIPLFDSNQQTLSFEQIFRPDRFSGQDRLTDAHHIALGMTNTFIGLESGRQWLELSAGSILRLTKPKVLIGAPTTTDNDRLSPFILRLQANPVRPLHLDVNWIYSPISTKQEEFFARLQFKRSGAQVMNVSYKDKNADEQLRLSMHWPLLRQLNIGAAWRYDLRRNKTIETLFGIEYSNCCWRIRVGQHNFLTNTGGGNITANGDNITTNKGLFLRLQLRGFGSAIAAEREVYSDAINGFEERQGL